MIFWLGDLSPPQPWVVVLSVLIGTGMILAGGVWLGIILIGLILVLSAPRVINRLRRR
jgi:hypothetical protein